MSAPRHIVVWDLDHTLGEFSALERSRRDDVPVTVRLRPGLEAALERLSAEGFAHVVLTLASPSYAEMALWGTGIRRYFLEVASCPGHRPKGDAHGVAATYGIPLEEAGDRLFFVGDHPWFDAPRDPRVVFHIEPAALRRPAGPLAALILELRRRGEGSLRGGFDRLAAERAAGEKMARHDLPGVGPVVLLPREDECPVVLFEEEPAAHEAGTTVTFVPAEIRAGGA
jgi:hypothetical protein